MELARILDECDDTSNKVRRKSGLLHLKEAVLAAEKAAKRKEFLLEIWDNADKILFRRLQDKESERCRELAAECVKMAYEVW